MGAVNALARGRARRSLGGSGTWARDPVVGIGQRWPHTFARAAARAPRIAAIAAAGSSPRASISRLIVGVGGHRAEQRRLGTHQRGVGQAVIAQRNCDRQIQHRLARVVHRPRQPPRTQRPRQRAPAKPLTAAVCSSIAAPPDEINDSRPDSTRTPRPQRLRFTYGVPFSSRDLDH